MPVWHRETAQWRETGELAVVGITQEQHPARTRLFAQWHEIDWPILWDPFNLTTSKVVPYACAVDEDGVVRQRVQTLDGFEEGFLRAEFEPTGAHNRLVLFDHGATTPHQKALASLLWQGTAGMDDAITTLESLVAGDPENGALRFHAGVARRMRYDSSLSRPEDFQAAIDHWVAAREIDPNQYIWRRRIQQYGPRLDKPYPFYTWIEDAKRTIRGRGETPVELAVGLSGSELAGAIPRFEPGPDAVSPDAQGRIGRDVDDLVTIETAVAFDTTGKSRTATVHIVLRPDAERDVHWTNDVEPLAVWFGDPGLPVGWEASRQLLVHDAPGTEVSSEVRTLDLEVRVPKGAKETTIGGYALYYVCEGASGTCVYKRRDFAVTIVKP